MEPSAKRPRVEGPASPLPPYDELVTGSEDEVLALLRDGRDPIAVCEAILNEEWADDLTVACGEMDHDFQNEEDFLVAALLCQGYYRVADWCLLEAPWFAAKADSYWGSLLRVFRMWVQIDGGLQRDDQGQMQGPTWAGFLFQRLASRAPIAVLKEVIQDAVGTGDCDTDTLETDYFWGNDNHLRVRVMGWAREAVDDDSNTGSVQGSDTDPEEDSE